MCVENCLPWRVLCVWALWSRGTVWCALRNRVVCYFVACVGDHLCLLIAFCRDIRIGIPNCSPSSHYTEGRIRRGHAHVPPVRWQPSPYYERQHGSVHIGLGDVHIMAETRFGRLTVLFCWGGGGRGGDGFGVQHGRSNIECQ